MVSSSSSVGLKSHKNIQYVAPGIYVGSLTFSSSITVKNSKGSNEVVMWMVKTIVATSSQLMTAAVVQAQVLEKLATNRMARLNVVSGLGKVIGMASAADLSPTIFYPADYPSLVEDAVAADNAKAKPPTGNFSWS